MRSGGITVETAIVVPFVILVLGALLWGSLLYHDLLLADTLAAHQASSMVIGQGDEVDLAMGSLVVSPSGDYGLNEGWWQDSVNSTVSGSGTTFILGFELGLDKNYNLEAINPKTMIRAVDVADDLTDQIKVLGDMKSQWNDKVHEIEDLLSQSP